MIEPDEVGEATPLELFGDHWHMRCLALAWSYPRGTIEHAFWHSARWQFSQDEQRALWLHNPELALEHWYAYFRSDLLLAAQDGLL